jgi:hypothetical protein
LTDQVQNSKAVGRKQLKFTRRRRTELSLKSYQRTWSRIRRPGHTGTLTKKVIKRESIFPRGAWPPPLLHSPDPNSFSVDSSRSRPFELGRGRRRVIPNAGARRGRGNSYLVDPASSHMLVSKIKPCMCKYKLFCTVKLRMAH